MQPRCLLLIALVVALVVAMQTSPASGETRRALLIGINEYQRVPDLRGALNDIALVRETLESRLGFDPKNVTVLENAAATREGILAALAQLVAQTASGDFVYVHYSGHGSQVIDKDGDEEDALDETLVPHDGRTEGVPDVVDDELAEILGRLKTARVVIVLDSCHSGTATRGDLTVTARLVPTDSRSELYPARPRTRAVVPVLGGRHLVFTASAENQLALDGPVDGRPHGLFSYALTRSLGRAADDVTPRELLERVEAELERVKAQLGLQRMPDPQLEAPAGRLDVPLVAKRETPAETRARLPYSAVGADSTPERVRLVGAARLGGGPGSLWAVYPAGENRFPPGGAIGEVEIAETEGEDSFGALTPGGVAIPEAGRAVALIPPPVAGRVPVYWSTESALREAVEALVPEVAAVGSGEFARFVVELDTDRCRVYGADGVSLVAEFDRDEGAAPALAAIFTRSMTSAELLDLDNAATAMTLDLDVVGHGSRTISRGARGMQLVGDTSATVDLKPPSGARTHSNSLQLRVRASHDCYLTVADVDPSGHLSALFPNRISEDRNYIVSGFITAGDEFLIPDSLEPGNAAGFYVDYAPPAGTDTLRAFCMSELAAAEALRAVLHSVSAIDTRQVETRSTPRISGELRRGLARLASRGLVLVPDAPLVSPALLAPTATAPAPLVNATVSTAPTASTAVPESPSMGDAGRPSGPAPAGVALGDWVAASVTVEVLE